MRDGVWMPLWGCAFAGARELLAVSLSLGFLSPARPHTPRYSVVPVISRQHAGLGASSQAAKARAASFCFAATIRTVSEAHLHTSSRPGPTPAKCRCGSKRPCVVRCARVSASSPLTARSPPTHPSLASMLVSLRVPQSRLACDPQAPEPDIDESFFASDEPMPFPPGARAPMATGVPR